MRLNMVNPGALLGFSDAEVVESFAFLPSPAIPFDAWAKWVDTLGNPEAPGEEVPVVYGDKADVESLLSDPALVGIVEKVEDQ